MGSYTVSYDDTSCLFQVSGVATGTDLHFYIRHEPEIASDPVVDTFLTFSGNGEYGFTGLTPDTDYAVNVGTRIGNTDSTNWFGKQTFTTKSSGGDNPDIPTPVRPPDWIWWSNIQSGAVIAISADEWNAFCDRINEFRSYVGLYEIHFSRAFRGMPISAAIVNEARDAIYPMNNYVCTGPQPGDVIYASFFLNLSNALNSVQ